MVAQGTQAVGGFVIQVLAARSLGAEGLGQFGLLYGTLVLAAGIASGFVGDSMTVLDRQELSVRAALQNWLVFISAFCAATGFLASWATGFVECRAALIFGAATFVFLIEDAVRRLLMAALSFWRIALIDIVSLLAMVAALALLPAITLESLFVAVMVGQLSAIAAGICVLPAQERWVARPLPAQHRAVAAYGLWRSVQYGLQPSLLALMRVSVIAILGLAAAGELEAARIYAAPAMLAAYGFGWFLFAKYAIAKAQPMHSALRSADKEAIALLMIVVALGVCAVAALPLMGRFVTGRDVSALTVVGWLVYTLSVAAVTPYAALAAVRGMQAAVLLVRIADSTLSLVLVAVLAYWVESIEWLPFGLAVGLFAGALTLRQYVLRRRGTEVVSLNEAPSSGMH
jgi:O-antigen/teichoic acid export membrane protein